MSDIVTIGDATLYCGDCRDVLPTIGKVDVVMPERFTAACERIENAQRQSRMFA